MSKICIVIPCYNEAQRIDKKYFMSFLETYCSEYDLFFINDGSTDSTVSLLSDLVTAYPDNCTINSMEKNSGKAEAVRSGVQLAAQTAKYSYIAYFDADMATPLDEIKFMKEVVTNNPEVVMVLCSRMKRLGAKVSRKVSRHYLGRIFATFASVILKLPVYDTQCGAKLIKADVIPYVFSEQFITSWLFDVEILARLRNSNRNSILDILYEHPVTRWKDIDGSKLKLKHMIKVPFDLLRIRNKYN